MEKPVIGANMALFVLWAIFVEFVLAPVAARVIPRVRAYRQRRREARTGRPQPTEAAPQEAMMRCPNLQCGYEGPLEKAPRCSLELGLILCYFGLLPGIVYFLLARGHRYTCPKCGFSISSGGETARVGPNG